MELQKCGNIAQYVLCLYYLSYKVQYRQIFGNLFANKTMILSTHVNHHKQNRQTITCYQ